MASVYRSNIAGRLSSLPAEIAESANSSIIATFHTASANGEHANFLVEQGKAALAHTFGRAMLLGSIVILLNSAIVWMFQHRENDDTH